MVGGEARTERVTVASSLGQELLDYYETFMARTPTSLHRWTNKSLSLQACQDVAQEAFLNVSHRFQAGELDESVNVPAYLRTAAWNLARDRLRTERRLELAEDVSQAVPEPRHGEGAVDDVDPLEDLVWPAIEAMPVSQRRQVVHLQSCGLTDVEIAAALGIRADRVHRERHKAVVELRCALVTFIRNRHRNRTHVEKDGGQV